MAGLNWEKLDPATKAKLASMNPELAAELAKEQKQAAEFQKLLDIGEMLVLQSEEEARKATVTREQLAEELRQDMLRVPRDNSPWVYAWLSVIPIGLYILFG